MDTEQLNLLFEQRLKPKLAQLESVRLATLKKKNALAMSVGAFFIAVLSGFDSMPLLIMLFAIMMYCVFVFKLSWDKYRTSYKSQIMATLLREIDQSLAWDKDKFISKDCFEQSGLYDKKIDNYSGEDLIYGELEGFKVEMSELCAEQVILKPDGGSVRNPVFNGLFFKAQNHTPFSHCSYILPKDGMKKGIKEKLFGDLYNNRIGQKVTLPKSEFSQYFTVISSEPDAILQILTPELMLNLVEYRKQQQEIPLLLSFVGQNIYIAIPEGRDLFEPKLDMAVTEFEVVAALFQDLVFFTGLLQALGLKSNSQIL